MDWNGGAGGGGEQQQQQQQQQELQSGSAGEVPWATGDAPLPPIFGNANAEAGDEFKVGSVATMKLTRCVGAQQWRDHSPVCRSWEVERRAREVVLEAAVCCCTLFFEPHPRASSSKDRSLFHGCGGDLLRRSRGC